MIVLVSDRKSGRIVVGGLAHLLAICAGLQLYGQVPQSNMRITSEVKHIGAAEVKSVAPESPFDPNHQPDVYWHDAEWTLDISRLSADGVLSGLRIHAATGESFLVKLPNEFQQINSILRAPEDRAIVMEEDNTGSGGFAIVNLRTGELADKVSTGISFISPDRRFILYKNWFPSHAESYGRRYAGLCDQGRSFCNRKDSASGSSLCRIGDIHSRRFRHEKETNS